MRSRHVWMSRLAVALVLACACTNFDRHPDASTADAPPADVPADVSAPPPNALANVTRISAGRAHTCAVTGSGAVWCWGRNEALQTGATVSSTCSQGPCTPYASEVMGASGVAQAGGAVISTCARDGVGRVFCWGDNTYGQAGLMNMNSVPRPMLVPALPAMAEIAVGGAHACGRATEGDAVHCWGYGEIGQIGDGLRPSGGRLAARVRALDGAARVFAGDAHGCVIDADGGVRCWGATTAGQAGALPGEECPATILGGWPTRCLLSPAALPAFRARVAELALGTNHSCARLDDGSVWCWGSDEFGQLGGVATEAFCAVPNDSRDTRMVPCRAAPSHVRSLASVERIWTGPRANHTCARLRGGELRCWGDNRAGQLGDGSTVSARTPAVTRVAAHIEDLAAGEQHTCAVVAGGRVLCWGDNLHGQLAAGEAGPARGPGYALRAP